MVECPEEEDLRLSIGEFVGVVLGVTLLCMEGLGGGTGLDGGKEGVRLPLVLVGNVEWVRFEHPNGQGELGSERETGIGLVGSAIVVVGAKNCVGGGGGTGLELGVVLLRVELAGDC